MIVKLVYFAWLRERFGMSEEQVELPESVKSVSDLFDWFETRGEEFANVMEHRDILQVAIDQLHVQNRDTLLEGVSEIAIFPPMTGG
jgi:molybdopterin synthase sulfur carrier subunit